MEQELAKYRRMKVRWTKEEGFSADVPCNRWLMFCAGAALLFVSLPGLVVAVRWW